MHSSFKILLKIDQQKNSPNSSYFGQLFEENSPKGEIWHNLLALHFTDV
jgi:hypothetical protein